MSLPMIFVALTLQISMFITITFVGRLEGAIYIAATTIAMTICNVTGCSVLYGSCVALDSLVSQAYGAKSYRLMGLHCQRAMVILSIATVAVIFVWMQTEYILNRILGIDYETSVLAGKWAKMYAIGLWPTIMFEILRKFSQCQQMIWPIVVSASIAASTNWLSTYILVHVYNFGFMGCATGFVVSQWVAFLSLASIIIVRKCYIFYWLRDRPADHNGDYMDTSVSSASPLTQSSEHGKAGTSLVKNILAIGLTTTTAKVLIVTDDPEDNWPPVSMAIFKDWLPFLRLGFPSAVSLFIEWGSYEVTSIFAGRLGTVSLAAHGIFSVVATFMYRTPVSVAMSSATLTGNLLGEGKPDDAWHMVSLGLWTDLIIGMVQGVLIIVLGSYWGHVFTTDADVLAMLHSCLPVFALFIMADNTMCASATLLRNTGNPSTTVWANGTACIIFMLPLGFVLSEYTGLGLNGPWLSMAITWGTLASVYTFVLYTMNWQQQADEAQERSRIKSMPSPSPSFCGDMDKPKTNGISKSETISVAESESEYGLEVEMKDVENRHR